MSKTLRQLVTNCAARGEIENLTDATWTVWINDGIARLRDLLMATNGGYFEKTPDTPLTTVVNQEDYALPADFLRLTAVEIADSNGDWITLEQYRHDDRNLLRNTEAAFVTDRLPRYYSLRGTNISLLPLAQEGGRTIRLKYVPMMTSLDASKIDDDPVTESISGIEEYFSEYIELWAVLQAKIRLEEDTLPFERMLTRARDRINNSAPQRDSNAPRVLGGAVPRAVSYKPFRGW